MSVAEGAKKAKVDAGIVKSGTAKGDEFADFSFKEGNTSVLRIQDIFVQEKGKEALKKGEETHAAPKVKGGAKGKKKAVSKSAAKEKKTVGKKSAESTEVRKSVDKILKYTPNKSGSRKETP